MMFVVGVFCAGAVQVDSLGSLVEFSESTELLVPNKYRYVRILRAVLATAAACYWCEQQV